MNHMKAMLVDGDVAFRNKLRDEMKRRGAQVREAGNRNEALESARSWMPDLIVMNTVLPGSDGLELLGKLAEMNAPERPMVLVVSPVCRSEVAVRAMELGAGYFMALPVSAELICDRALEFMTYREEPVKSSDRREAPQVQRESGNAERAIRTTLLELGIPERLKGSQYYFEGVVEAMKDERMLRDMTGLCEKLGAKHGVSGGSVARAMQYALNVARTRMTCPLLNGLDVKQMYPREVLRAVTDAARVR